MIETAVPPANIDQLSRHLKLLANPKRLQIIHLLMEGMQCNCVLGDALGMPANLVSHHLSLLRDAGLVDVTRDAVDGRWLYYTINEAAMTAISDAYAAFFDLSRIKPRQQVCGPTNSTVALEQIIV